MSERAKRDQGPRERETERVQSKGCNSGLADDFKEGKLTMLFNRKQRLGAVRSAGRTILASFAAAMLTVNAGAQGQGGKDPTAVPMEELMNWQVTSVAKKPQKVADAAAAVFVITQ